MKSIIAGIVISVCVPSVALAQTWQQWQQQNPTYSENLPSKVQAQPAIPFSSSPTSQQKQPKVVGNVMATRAVIERKEIGESHFAYLKIEVQNTTNTEVRNVQVTYEIGDGLESDTLRISPSTITIGEKGSTVNYPINIGGEKLPQRVNIKIRQISWTNQYGHQLTNNKWGEMSFWN